MSAVSQPYACVRFAALAHRGGYGPDVPSHLENTLRAFRQATQLGYRFLETDVHVTADGQLIAFHDAVLDRVTDGCGRVADLPWSEVSAAKIGGSEPIPTLDELLETFPDSTFNIDIKAPAAVGPLVEALRRHGAEPRSCVGSFNTPAIVSFRRLTGGRVATSASSREVAGFALPLVRRCWPLRAQVFQIPRTEPRTGLPLLTPALLAAAHARGALVHVWTVNDRADMERLIEWGVDGLVSDNIVTLKAVMVERGIWEGEQ